MFKFTKASMPMLLALLLIGACSSPSQPTTGAATTSAESIEPAATLIVNANILPMHDRADAVLENQQIRIENDRIVAVGPDLLDRADARVQVIDAKGGYVLPGLAEMHGHVPPANSFEDIAPRYLDDVLYLYIARGVTTVRGMLGYTHQLDLKADIAEGKRVGPTLYLAGPSFSGNSIDSVDQAIRRVREQAEQGWDLLKIHPGLTLEMYLAMAAEADANNIDFAGHVPADVGLGQALQAGQRTIDHLDGYLEYLSAIETPITDAQLHQAVMLTKEHGTAVVPTQALWKTLIGASSIKALEAYDELKYMPPVVRERWLNYLEEQENPYFNATAAALQSDNRDRLLQALHAGGVPVLFGTDAPQLFSVPGFSVKREIDAMRTAGLAPADILWSATRAVGDYFAEQDRFGSVRAGQRADLVMVAENPLTDIDTLAKPRGVMVRGQWFSAAAIDAKLAEIAAAYAD